MPESERKSTDPKYIAIRWVLLLTFGIVLGKFNVSEYQRSLAPGPSSPLTVLGYFMLAWVVTFIGCTFFFSIRNKLLRYEALLFAAGALVALLFNIYHWVQIVQRI